MLEPLTFRLGKGKKTSTLAGEMQDAQLGGRDLID